MALSSPSLYARRRTRLPRAGVRTVAPSANNDVIEDSTTHRVEQHTTPPLAPIKAGYGAVTPDVDQEVIEYGTADLVPPFAGPAVLKDANLAHATKAT